MAIEWAGQPIERRGADGDSTCGGLAGDAGPGTRCSRAARALHRPATFGPMRSTTRRSTSLALRLERLDPGAAGQLRACSVRLAARVGPLRSTSARPVGRAAAGGRAVACSRSMPWRAPMAGLKAEVLRLSPTRRAAYLQLVGGGMTGFLHRLAGMALGASGRERGVRCRCRHDLCRLRPLSLSAHTINRRKMRRRPAPSRHRLSCSACPRASAGAPEPESPLEAQRSKTEFPRAASAIISSQQSLSPPEAFSASLNASGIDIAPGHRRPRFARRAHAISAVAPSRLVTPHQTAAASRFDASTAGRTAVAPASPDAAGVTTGCPRGAFERDRRGEPA